MILRETFGEIQMKKTISIIFVSFMLASLFAVPVFAASNEKVDAFVCPVLGGKAGENGNHKGLTYIDNTAYGVDSFYTNIRGASGKGPHIKSVPIHATNMDGSGNPHGPYSSPGDTDYTAIWATE
jgi:hypothetical protein